MSRYECFPIGSALIQESTGPSGSSICAARPSVVHVEYRTGGIYIEQEEEVKIYSDIFMRLEEIAMSSDQSLALIKTISGEGAY